jgi:integrase
MAVKFTEQALRKLSVPEGARDQQWFDSDTRGFGVRKFRTGRALYFVKFMEGGKQRKVTIGPYQPGNLVQMRRKAEDYLVEARQKAQETPRHVDISLGEAVDRYPGARRSEVDPAWFRELSRFLKQYWANLHHKSLRDLNRGELVRKLDVVSQERGLRTADHSQKALSALFSWAIDRGYADANPLTRLKARTKGNGRARVLSLQELVSIWQVAGDDDFGDVVKLLTLTVQRKSEIGDLRWTEVELSDDRQINLPEERSKNGLAHSVPLSDPAGIILSSRKRQVHRDYVFGSGQRGFQGWSKAKRRLEIAACTLLAPQLMKGPGGSLDALSGAATRDRAGQQNRKPAPASADAVLHSIMPHWTLHDLRRTGATMIADFGLAEPHIIEAVLNHISGTSKEGVAGIYNRARYEAQKRAALERWATFLMTAIDEYNKAGFEGVVAYERREKQKLRGSLPELRKLR